MSAKSFLPPNSLFPLFSPGVTGAQTVIGRHKVTPLADSAAGGGATGSGATETGSRVLIELDKGLRSSSVGDQFEAISFFPRLFEVHPYPVIINTALLKLADHFRICNNQTRGYILKVLHACQVHFPKILNLDEISKRFLSVMYTNDPVARALTLRVFGAMAVVLENKVDVHQRLKISLEAHDQYELEAAIFAVDRICATSPIFSVSVSDKLSVMVEGLELTASLKLKLIRIFRHMHHNPKTARKAKELCERLLGVYDTSDFVVCILDTLTHLSAKFLLEVGDQVALLFRVFRDDPRQGVKMCALRNLATLARLKVSFKLDQVETLVATIQTPHYDDLLLRSLVVITRLLENPAQWTQISPSVVDCKVLEALVHHSNHKISSAACEALMAAVGLTNFALNRDEVIPRFAASLCFWINKECLPETQTAPEQELIRHLKTLLALARINPVACEVSCQMLIPLIPHTQGRSRQPLLKGLSLLARACPSSFQMSSDLQNLLHSPQLNSLGASSQAQILQICFRAFSLPADLPSRITFVRRALEIVSSLATLDSSKALSENHLILFEIAEEATCTGYHEISQVIFPLLVGALSTESFHFWLTALSRVAVGEATRTLASAAATTPFESISPALVKLQEGLVAVEALSATDAPRNFQKFYLELRIQYLELFRASAASTTQLDKRPAGATYLLLQNGTLAAQWRELADQVEYLANMSIDIDKRSHELLISLSMNCSLLELALVELGARFRSSADEDIRSEQRHHPRLHSWLRSIRMGQAVQSSLLSDRLCFAILQRITSTNTLSPEDVLSFLRELHMVPHSVPAFFFHGQATTSIHLTTQPRWNGTDPLWIREENQLVLKLEGIIQRASSKRQRGIKKVRLGVLVTEATRHDAYPNNLAYNRVINDDLADKIAFAGRISSLVDDSVPESGTISPDSPAILFEATVKGSYFTCTTLLDVESSTATPQSSSPAQKPSLHSINIHVAAEDEAGRTWQIGPDLSIPIQILRK